MFLYSSLAHEQIPSIKNTIGFIGTKAYTLNSQNNAFQDS